MKIVDVVRQVSNTSDCRVYLPSGQPTVGSGHFMPDDLREFYDCCGGMILFESSDYPLFVVSPQDFLLANPVIIGEVYEEDITSFWYIVGSNGSGDHVTIDLSQERSGKCYDSFYERHGVVGSCPVIALSFTDLVSHTLNNMGRHWYWEQPGFDYLGDAYD